MPLSIPLSIHPPKLMHSQASHDFDCPMCGLQHPFSTAPFNNRGCGAVLIWDGVGGVEGGFPLPVSTLSHLALQAVRGSEG